MAVTDQLQQEWDAFMVPTYTDNRGRTKKTMAQTWREANPVEWQKLQDYVLVVLQSRHSRQIWVYRWQSMSKLGSKARVVLQHHLRLIPHQTKPGNLRAKTTDQTTITIAWDAATDDVGVTNYKIYRNATLIGQGEGSAGGYADEWQDTGLICGTAYLMVWKLSMLWGM